MQLQSSPSPAEVVSVPLSASDPLAAKEVDEVGGNEQSTIQCHHNQSYGVRTAARNQMWKQRL